MIETSALEAWGCSARGLEAGGLELQCSRPGGWRLAAWGLNSMIGNWMIGNGFDDVSWFNTLDALREVGGFRSFALFYIIQDYLNLQHLDIMGIIMVVSLQIIIVLDWIGLDSVFQ